MRFILGLLIGAAVGVSIGLIVAPQAGSETRRQLQQRMKRGHEGVEDEAEAGSYEIAEAEVLEGAEAEEPAPVA